MIKASRFGYINYDAKVYVIVKKDSVYPMCYGKQKYLTIPTILKGNMQPHSKQTKYVHNSLIAFLKEIHTRPILKQYYTPQETSPTLERITCKDAINIAEMIATPLVVVLEDNVDGHVVFYKPKRTWHT